MIEMAQGILKTLEDQGIDLKDAITLPLGEQALRVHRPGKNIDIIYLENTDLFAVKVMRLDAKGLRIGMKVDLFADELKDIIEGKAA